MATESTAASPASPASTRGTLKGRGRKEGPWARHFLRLDEHQSKTVFLSVCRFCLAAHSADPQTVPPPRKVPARRACQIPHLKRCGRIPPGQARADVDALLAVYGTLAVPYSPGQAKREPGADVSTVSAVSTAADGSTTATEPQPARPRRPRVPHVSKKVTRPPEDSTAAPAKRAKVEDSYPTPKPPQDEQMQSPSVQHMATTARSPVVLPTPQLTPPAQHQQQPTRSPPPPPQVLVHQPSPPQVVTKLSPPPRALVHQPPLRQVTTHQPPPPQVITNQPPSSQVLVYPPPTPAPQVTQPSARQLQALVADVTFENGIRPEWVESATLRRLVRWLRPELEHAVPTAGAVSGSLLTQAATSFSSSEQGDMEAFVSQGARVAVAVLVEVAEPALLRVHLSSLSASSCFDVRQISSTDRDDVSRLARELQAVVDRVRATNTPVGSVCLSAPKICAPALGSVARGNPQLIVVPCFADAVNSLASAAIRSPLARSTLLAVAEAVDAILSPPAAIDEAARAIPWQLVVFATVSATYGSPLEMARVEATRWTSAHEAVASLLRVRSALREFAGDHYNSLSTHPVARNVVVMLSDDAFWTACEALEAMLRPLVAAAYIASSGDATLAHVMAAFTDMARSLQPVNSERSLPRELFTQEQALLAQVETAWSRYGARRVSMLACFLHPETRSLALQLHETELTSAAQLVESAIEHFRVFFGANEPINKLRGDLMKWRNGSLAKNVRPEEFDNWLSYWEYIRECKIAVELARLAIFVLSAGVHSGTCEDLWLRRTVGLGVCGIDASRHHSASLLKLKELEMARLAIERQRRSESKSEMERRGHGGVTSATELSKVVAQASGVNMDAGAMAHAVGASQSRSQAELEAIVDAWAGYNVAAPASNNGEDLIRGGTAHVSLSDLVGGNSRSDASI